MDHQRFDAVTRAIATAPSRRGLLGLLVAGAVAAARPRRSAAAWPDWAACPPGWTACGDIESGNYDCVDLSTDLDHCGACFEVCESGLVPVDCRDGQCVRANCPPELTYCGVIGGCRDLTADPESCGACGTVCESGICAGGVCTPVAEACGQYLTLCGGECVDTSADLQHCGACFELCESGLVAVACRDGQCVRA